MEGGLQAAFKRFIENAVDPAEAERQLHLQYEAIKNSVRTAEVFSIQEIIDPRDTRRWCVNWIRNAYDILRTSPDRIKPVPGGYKV